MASGLKLVLFILLTTCTSAMNPTMKSDNPTMYSQSTSPTNDITNQTVMSGSSTCNLAVNQSLLATISKLTQNSAINIVELQLFLSSENKSPLLPYITWIWANKVGREIMSILSMNSCLDLEVIRTLTVGRTRLAVQIYENFQGCIQSKENEERFVAKTLLQKLFPTSNTDYQLCYVTRKGTDCTLLMPAEKEYTCCKIISDDRQSEYYVYYSYLTDTIESFLSSYGLMLLVIISPFFLSTIFKSSRNRKYYKITDSPMSLSSIIHSVFFEGYGPIKSFVRRLIFIGLVVFVRLYFFVSCCFLFSYQVVLIYIQNVFFVPWAHFFLFVFLNKNDPTTTFINRAAGSFPDFSKYTKYLHDYTGYDLKNVSLSGNDYQSIVNVFSLPFDLKRWRRMLKTVFEETSVACRDLPFHKKIWEYFFKVALRSILYVVIISMILFLLLLIKMVSYSFFCSLYGK